jgi:excisionase family DNA binding protein
MAVSDTKKGAMSVSEAAEYLGIGRSLAYESVRQGLIPARRIGNRWVIPISTLRSWVAGDREATKEVPSEFGGNGVD